MTDIRTIAVRNGGRELRLKRKIHEPEKRTKRLHSEASERVLLNGG